MIRVLLADDQPLIRSALEAMIEVQDDMRLVDAVGTGHEAVEACRTHRVDVALLDIRMPGLTGIEACHAIRRATPSTKVLILTTFDVDENLFAAIEAGARGFLTKDEPGERIADAVREVHAGRSVVSPRATHTLLEEVARRPAAGSGSPVPMSGRERDVLELLTRGLSNAEIAAQLFVAETTVKTHVGSLLRKVGVRDRLHLVVWAYQNGLA